MTDPHNPSQQRGVRICDLPRTGAAAMSQKLELGDELLSINDKTMSRLTFDEIMDFIIEADKERVDLLFRRPILPTTTISTVGGGGGEKKMNHVGVAGSSGGGGGRNASKSSSSGGGGAATTALGEDAEGIGGNTETLSPMALGGVGSYSNSVKWIDEKSGYGGGGKGGGGKKQSMEAVPEVEDFMRHHVAPNGAIGLGRRAIDQLAEAAFESAAVTARALVDDHQIAAAFRRAAE